MRKHETIRASSLMCPNVNLFEDIKMNGETTTDALTSLAERRKYNRFHNRYMDCPRSIFSISYLGRHTTIGALNEYVRSIYCLAEGSLMLEVVPLTDRFCISFELVRSLKRFINAFLASLAEKCIHYEVDGPLLKRLAGVVLPQGDK